MTVVKAWKAAGGQLQMELPRSVRETWIRDLEVEGFHPPDRLILRVGDPYAREWLQDRLTSSAERVLTGVVGRGVRVEFTVR